MIGRPQSLRTKARLLGSDIAGFLDSADKTAIYPEWFGLIPNDISAATRNAAAIRQAFDVAVEVKAGEIRFGVGDFYTEALDFTALNLQPLRLTGTRGGGQNTVIPGTRIIYTGAGARFIDARGNRSLEFENLGINHTDANFTGTLLDLSALTGRSGTNHTVRRVLFGSTAPTVDQTALAVNLDGTHTIVLEDCTFSGLANGVSGKDSTGGFGFANNVVIRGGFGAGISGHHFLHLGKAWAIRDYTAEPRQNGTPNLVLVNEVGGVEPNVVLDSVDCEDGSAFGFWVDMAFGRCIVIGGDYRIDLGGAAFKASGPMNAIIIYAPRVAASVGASGCSVLDGGGFQHETVHVIAPVGVNVDTPIRNLPPTPGIQDVGDAQIQTEGTAAPTTETWPRGAIVWNTEPSAGGNAGWICTTAGTPGTWKTFGNIAL